MKVIVAIYTHEHGEDVRVFGAWEDARKWKQGLAAEWWDHEFPGEPPPKGSDIDPNVIAEEYFDRMSEQGEYFSMIECKVEGDMVMA